jgi:hypothetical protein
MLNLPHLETLEESTLIDLLVQYSEQCAQSIRGASLGEQEYKDFKDAIDKLAAEIRRRKGEAWEAEEVSGE